MRAKKQNVFFVVGPHDLIPHHHVKNRKDASTDSGLDASAQTLVLRRTKDTTPLRKYEKVRILSDIVGYFMRDHYSS